MSWISFCYSTGMEISQEQRKQAILNAQKSKQGKIKSKLDTHDGSLKGLHSVECWTLTLVFKRFSSAYYCCGCTLYLICLFVGNLHPSVCWCVFRYGLLRPPSAYAVPAPSPPSSAPRYRANQCPAATGVFLSRAKAETHPRLVQPHSKRPLQEVEQKLILPLVQLQWSCPLQTVE